MKKELEETKEISRKQPRLMGVIKDTDNNMEIESIVNIEINIPAERAYTNNYYKNVSHERLSEPVSKRNKKIDEKRNEEKLMSEKNDPMFGDFQPQVYLNLKNFNFPSKFKNIHYNLEKI